MSWFNDDEHDEDWWTRFFVIAAFILIFSVVLIIIQNSSEPKSTPKMLPRSTTTGQSTGQSSGWSDTKKVLYDVIYKDHNIDLYYGCHYTGRQVDLSTCDYKSDAKRAKWVEAEHIVPASILARGLPCWEEGGRKNCENTDPRAQAMIFDLHNLAPSVGEVNGFRSNKRYAETPLHEELIPNPHEPGLMAKTFEPQDCIKGDVARVWLYAHQRHGVVLVPGEEEMFERWSAQDPVSPWESEREKRIRKYTFISNPYVKGQNLTMQVPVPGSDYSSSSFLSHVLSQ